MFLPIGWEVASRLGIIITYMSYFTTSWKFFLGYCRLNCFDIGHGKLKTVPILILLIWVGDKNIFVHEIHSQRQWFWAIDCQFRFTNKKSLCPWNLRIMRHIHRFDFWSLTFYWQILTINSSKEWAWSSSTPIMSLH